MPDWFKFCGKSCKDYGVTVLEFPPLTTSEESITSVTVPGRAGDLEIRDGSYKSFELTLTCYIADLSNVAKIAAWLSGAAHSGEYAGQILHSAHDGARRI